MLRLEGACPCDIFCAIDTVSLGLLSEGVYNIKLIGSSFVFHDILTIPTSAPESLYQFDVTVISKQTGEAVPNLPLSLWIDSPVDTTLMDTTDLLGHILFTYDNPNVDSVHYYMYGPTWAKLGIPEVITLGIVE